jgi:hypothetical protein
MKEGTDIEATVVLDFCDPGSAKEQAVYWAWIITVASMLLLSILRMVCSQKRVRKLKRNLNKKATLRDLDAARLSEQPPELTIVLKNKRTHECFCDDNNAFIRRNMRDSEAAYRSLKKDISFRKSFWSSVVGRKKVYLRALIWALISAGLSGFAQHSVLEYSDQSITQILDCIYNVATDIVFLTMLLVANYVSAEVSRWHSIQHAAWRVQGSIVDVARLIGSHIENDPEMKIAYRAHRYLTLAHILLHQDANKHYKFELDDLVHAGLVDHREHSEGRALQLLSELPEDGVLGWIEQLLNYCLEKRHLPTTSNFVIEVISQLQEQMQFFRNAQDDQPPASWSILMGVLIHVQSMLFCLGFAGSTTTGHFTGTDMCAALVTTWRPFLATFIVTSVFNFLYVLCDVLQDPYDGEVGVDNLDIDTLVIRTERLTYHHLRHAHMDVRKNISQDLATKGYIVQEFDDDQTDRFSMDTRENDASRNNDASHHARTASFQNNPMRPMGATKARAWSRANSKDGELNMDPAAQVHAGQVWKQDLGEEQASL